MAAPLKFELAKGVGGSFRPTRMSFDIDDTLVCRFPGRPNERNRFGFIGAWLCEPLRQGTCFLVRELRARGSRFGLHDLRAEPVPIRLWLLLYGIRVDGVVNDARHRREVSRQGLPRLPSKYPPALGIDLHLDDSEGVRTEGDEHGFKVVVIRRNDENWTRRVLEGRSLSSVLVRKRAD